MPFSGCSLSRSVYGCRHVGRSSSDTIDLSSNIVYIDVSNNIYIYIEVTVWLTERTLHYMRTTLYIHNTFCIHSIKSTHTTNTIQILLIFYYHSIINTNTSTYHATQGSSEGHSRGETVPGHVWLSSRTTAVDEADKTLGCQTGLYRWYGVCVG